MSFWVKINPFIKLLFPKYVWDIPNREKKVYLTFDDGPTPEITAWTLEQLKAYDAKATFFCIGNNIEKHPAIFEQVIAEGHAIGNHTFNHVKGWETDTKDYIENTMKCSMLMEKQEARSKKQDKELFRPPYGKIKPAQSRILRKMGYKIIMWDVLSCDFDRSITPEQCLANVLNNVTTGSIIVFHDSLKAEPNLRYVLPKTLAYLKERGFVCAKIE
ncbi:polysaccharide deacetylase family protein [Flavobacterium sp. N1994]|uniref:polysaccharide deacetylase family protein n=1 Tax=Flavobacterium sp. N1994 TaxID=2986827 RepID=UPI00222356B6|nr:polysaccharide deacetylase family protein [Flavobacterium sp. N1994]